MRHLLFVLAVSAAAQTPLTSPYQDYRHFGEFDFRGAKTFRPKIVALTPTNGAVCLTPYEQVYAWAGGSLHICRPASYGATEGVWSTVSGGGSSFDATMAAINDFLTVRTSATVLTTSGSASLSARVNGGVGNTSYGFTAASTLTLSGSGAGGIVYLAQRDDGVLTFTYTSIACTFTPVGYTLVTGTTFTGKATATATITNCQWDSSGVTDYRAFFSQGKKITVGTGLSKTETDTEVQLTGTAASFDPRVRENFFYRSHFGDFQNNAASMGYVYNGGCSQGTAQAATTTDFKGVEYYGANCVFRWQPATSALPSFLNGSYVYEFRFFRNTSSAANYYLGVLATDANDTTPVANGAFLRWNHGGSTYECVVRNGASDSVTAVAVAGGNDTSRHWGKIWNDGTSGQLKCQIDSGAISTVTGATMPTLTNAMLGFYDAGTTRVVLLEHVFSMTGR